MNIVQTVTQNIRRYRKSLHMSVDELAVLVGVSPKTVSRWETAVSDIKLTELERVCDALSVTPKQIFEPSTVPDL